MIEGERHGLLVFLEDLGINKNHHSLGRFRCDCGNTCEKELARVKSGEHAQLWMSMASVTAPARTDSFLTGRVQRV